MIVAKIQHERDRHNVTTILYSSVGNVMGLADSFLANPDFASYTYNKWVERLGWGSYNTLDDIRKAVEELKTIPCLTIDHDEEAVARFFDEHGGSFMIWSQYEGYPTYETSIFVKDKNSEDVIRIARGKI